jgi:hypothetical protein
VRRAGEPSSPMAPEARAHLERGLRAYADREWREAIAAFRAGYAIDPHPDFLFPWAQATRLSGDCAGALPLYRKALAAAATGEDRRDIEGLIARCEEEVERSPPAAEPEPEPEPEPAAAPARENLHVARRAPASSSPPWYTDRFGGALAIGGAIGLATGAGFLIAASGADHDATAAGSLDDFVAAADRADRQRLIGAIALGAGAGLAGVAILRYAWVASRSANELSVALAPAPGGAVLAVVARFW